MQNQLLKICFLWISFSGLYAQSNLQIFLDQVVSYPNHLEDWEHQQLSQTLISSFASHQVYLADDHSLPLALKASFLPLSSEQFQGLQSKTIDRANLNLELQHRSTGQVIDATQIRLSGSGQQQTEARRQAIQQLNGRHPSLKIWLKSIPNKIENYFHSSCAQLIKAANQALSRQQFSLALDLSTGFPATAPCAAEAATISDLAYQGYQKQNCAVNLRAARLALVSAKPNEAIDHLTKIDPTASCATEASTLVEEAATALEKQRSDKAAFLRKVYNNQVKIEEARAQTKKAIIGGQAGG